MRHNLVPIYGIDDFGLNLRTLTTLGIRLITVAAHFKYVNESELFPLSPRERKLKMEEWFTNSFVEAQARWPTRHFELIGTKKEPRGIRGKVKANNVRELRRIPQFGHIWIEDIPGLKRQRPAAIRRWFAVQARFAIQIEGKSRGIEGYEDRIVIVKALSSTDARRKLRQNFKDYGRPYLNGQGYMVRWTFESVLDVIELLDNAIDPNGTEVFSTFGRRRIKPNN